MAPTSDNNHDVLFPQPQREPQRAPVAEHTPPIPVLMAMVVLAFLAGVLACMAMHMLAPLLWGS